MGLGATERVHLVRRGHRQDDGPELEQEWLEVKVSLDRGINLADGSALDTGERGMGRSGRGQGGGSRPTPMVDRCWSLLPELLGLAVVGALPDGSGGGHLARMVIAGATEFLPALPGVVAVIAQDDLDRFIVFAAHIVERLDRDRVLPGAIPAQRALRGYVVPEPAVAHRTAVFGGVVVAGVKLLQTHPESEGEVPAPIGGRAGGGDGAGTGRCGQQNDQDSEKNPCHDASFHSCLNQM